jgi:hypothetical protein
MKTEESPHIGIILAMDSLTYMVMAEFMSKFSSNKVEFFLTKFKKKPIM